MRVGILGGSFNPAHEGHLHISREAMKRIGLQRVLWVVARQNPHKEKKSLAPFEERCQSALDIAMRASNILVSDIEKKERLCHSIDTINALKSRFPQNRFVWLLGADLMEKFHLWKKWRRIAQTLPIACLPRQGYHFRAASSQAAQALQPFLMDASDAALLPFQKPPAILFLNAPTHPLSASEIRKRRNSI